MTEITLNDLTAAEQKALNKAAQGTLNSNFGACITLLDKGLISEDTHLYITLTDLGRAVLAQAPVADNATDAGGRYRLRRWDSETSEWIDGVSQPWDVKETAIQVANNMAGDGERYMVVDRLFNPVYITGDEEIEASKPQPAVDPAKAAGEGGKAFKLADDSLVAEHVADVNLNYKLQAELARLRSALETIRDYPTVEADMDIGHQVAGMAIQAEVALDEVPPRSGLLTVLADKLTTMQAELATVKAALAAARLREAGLREALKQIALRSDLERPKKLEGEDGFSFGITHGLWRAGVIARKALAAGSEVGE